MSIDVAGLEVTGADELWATDQLEVLIPSAEPEQWWDGLAFTGVLDPKGSLFAVLLAGFATLAVVVVAFAAVSVVTGT